MDTRAPFGRVIVEKGDGVEAEAAFGGELSCEVGTDITGTDNGDAMISHRAAAIGRDETFTDHTKRDSKTGESCDGEDEIDEQDTSWDMVFGNMEKS